MDINSKSILFSRPALTAAIAAALAGGLTACGDSDQPAAVLPESATAELAILETSDLHANLLSYDYFRLAEDKSIGFERTATLIKQARADFPKTC